MNQNTRKIIQSTKLVRVAALAVTLLVGSHLLADDGGGALSMAQKPRPVDAPDPLRDSATASQNVVRRLQTCVAPLR